MDKRSLVIAIGALALFATGPLSSADARIKDLDLTGTISFTGAQIVGDQGILYGVLTDAQGTRVNVTVSEFKKKKKSPHNKNKK